MTRIFLWLLAFFVIIRLLNNVRIVATRRTTSQASPPPPQQRSKEPLAHIQETEFEDITPKPDDKP